MAIKTYAEQLESVQAAIAKIEADGQAYGMGKGGVSLSLTRANLAELYRREERLQALVAREQRGGGIGVRFVTPV